MSITYGVGELEVLIVSNGLSTVTGNLRSPLTDGDYDIATNTSNRLRDMRGDAVVSSPPTHNMRYPGWGFGIVDLVNANTSQINPIRHFGGGDIDRLVGPALNASMLAGQYGHSFFDSHHAPTQFFLRFYLKPPPVRESSDSFKYRKSFLRKIFLRFSTLESYSVGRVFSFRNNGASVLKVLIGHEPALTLVKQSGCVFLSGIHPVRNPSLKYQRLFLRHLGFDCIREGKYVKLTLSPNNVLKLDPTKEYHFESNRNSYIGGETPYDDLGVCQASKQVYGWGPSIVRPDLCARSSNAV
jgi:hypothetical protein